ncbi:hypothetical protein [Streptomyces phaeoluteigriseus]
MTRPSARQVPGFTDRGSAGHPTHPARGGHRVGSPAALGSPAAVPLAPDARKAAPYSPVDRWVPGRGAAGGAPDAG